MCLFPVLHFFVRDLDNIFSSLNAVKGDGPLICGGSRARASVCVVACVGLCVYECSGVA